MPFTARLVCKTDILSHGDGHPQQAAYSADAIPHEIAAGLIRTWLRFEVLEITVPVMITALAMKAKHGLSYWDAANISAARALGCRELYSEDMSHGLDIEGTVIIDPFRYR